MALTVTTVSEGQGSRAQQVSAPAKRMNATKITEAPTIDGVLDERRVAAGDAHRRLRPDRAG